MERFNVKPEGCTALYRRKIHHIQISYKICLQEQSGISSLKNEKLLIDLYPTVRLYFGNRVHLLHIGRCNRFAQFLLSSMHSYIMLKKQSRRINANHSEVKISWLTFFPR